MGGNYAAKTHNFTCPDPGIDRIAPRSRSQCLRQAPTLLDMSRNIAASFRSRPRAFITASVTVVVSTGLPAYRIVSKTTLVVSPLKA